MDTYIFFSPTAPALLDIDKLMGRSIDIGQDHVLDMASLTADQASKIEHIPRDNLLAVLLAVMTESQQKPKEEKNKKSNRSSFKL